MAGGVLAARSKFCEQWASTGAAGLETGDTADSEVCATPEVGRVPGALRTASPYLLGFGDVSSMRERRPKFGRATEVEVSS